MGPVHFSAEVMFISFKTDKLIFNLRSYEYRYVHMCNDFLIISITLPSQIDVVSQKYQTWPNLVRTEHSFGILSKGHPSYSMRYRSTLVFLMIGGG